MATLHFAVLIALPVLTIAWLLKRGTRPTKESISIGVALPLLLAVIEGLAGAAHVCAERPGWAQCLVPVGCAVLLLTFQAPGPARVATGAATLVLGAALFGHHMAVVHEPGVTSLREAAASGDPVLLENCRQVLRAMGKRKPVEVPAGFAEDTVPGFADEGRSSGERHEIQPEWHSWLTSLRRRRITPLGVWLPAGDLAKVADAAEWRERPAR